MHKAGFVNIIGKPNMGKSTLLNALLGERLAIITAKAQTTRHRILGLINDEEHQIVLSDTPGILEPHYKLHESMMSEVRSALQDADVLIVMTDPFDKGEDVAGIFEKIKKHSAAKVVLINKMDTAKPEDLVVAVERWEAILPDAKVFPFSALHNFGIDQLLSYIKSQLPESPPYYGKDELTNKPMRFFIGEMVREQVLEIFSKEIPYSIEVVVQEFKEEESIVHIRAEIMVARESQKAIVIGHQGEKIKQLGQQARLKMEAFLQKKVFLDLHIKVDKDWRNKEDKLKKYGYN
jgi:GTP-binding protein Era